MAYGFLNTTRLPSIANTLNSRNKRSSLVIVLKRIIIRITTALQSHSSLRKHTMPDHAPNENYLTPYKKWEAANGTDFGVTLWASPESQQLRFNIFTQMAFILNKTVLDIGSSRGDLATYLIEKKINYAHYTGVDGLADVIDFAKSRNIPDTSFACLDIIAQSDQLKKICPKPPQIVTISGTLNTMSDEQVMQVLESSWAITSETLIFNFLSDRSGRKSTPQDYPARRLNTLNLIDWAVKKTPLIKYRQDYFTHGHDATILMRKDSNSPA